MNRCLVRTAGTVSIALLGGIVTTSVCRAEWEPTKVLQMDGEAVLSRDHGASWDLPHRFILAKWSGNCTGANEWWPSSQATSTLLLPDGYLLTAFGTGYRSQPNAHGQSVPRDAGLVHWRPGPN